MCLAIPGKIKSIGYQYDGLVRMAQVSFGGITKEASLDMVPNAVVGDYVLVHVGVAIAVVGRKGFVWQHGDDSGQNMGTLGQYTAVVEQQRRPFELRLGK